MKYIFFGTPRFARIVLEELLDAGMPPIAVICNPDRPVGRKKTITPPPTKILAVERDASIDIIQPEKIDKVFIKKLRELEPDLFVIAAYAQILPPEVLDIPRFGALGVHPSLLPKLRGASPIQSAILASEATTGVTIYLMDEKTDHGPIIEQKNLETAEPLYSIPYPQLEDLLARIGGRLAAKILPLAAANTLTSHPQDESMATYTKKFKTEDAFVTPEQIADPTAAIDILKKINAFDPEPGAWTMRDGKRVKLLAGELRDGQLVITHAQTEGESARTSAND